VAPCIVRGNLGELTSNWTCVRFPPPFAAVLNICPAAAHFDRPGGKDAPAADMGSEPDSGHFLSGRPRLKPSRCRRREWSL
jgi:hypothetical protein